MMPKQHIGDELYNSIIRKLEKRKVYSSFKLNVWDADLAHMQLTSEYNKGLLFLCVVDIFSKYAWVVPLKDKKGITSNNVFPKNSDEFNQKPNKMWLGHGCRIMI